MISSRCTRGMAIASLMLCMGLGISACGSGTSTASQQEIAQAEKHARREKAEKEKERSLESKLAKLERENQLAKKRQREKAKRETKELQEAHVPVTQDSSGGSVAPPEPSAPSGTDCGDGVTAGPETSCGFALNVRAEYENFIGEGSGTIEAFSEANEEIYSMFCTAAPHECSGAISATVYFP